MSDEKGGEVTSEMAMRESTVIDRGTGTGVAKTVRVRTTTMMRWREGTFMMRRVVDGCNDVGCGEWNASSG